MVPLLEELLPFWKELTEQQKNSLKDSTVLHTVAQGTMLHSGSDDCVGLLVLTEGQLRTFIYSDEGREITLYRLFERDICLFSASCIMNSIQFDVSVMAERQTSFYLIPAKFYHTLMKESASVANFTNELMATRFSDVMWLLDQILYKRLDSRLAALLLEESALSESNELKTTHEMLAKHLGSAREVVTRMLKYFQAEGAVALSRGGILLTDQEKLKSLAQESLR
ncbi:MAG: Crp/Fnr family transcriptional regulator [Clostridiales bacterium]|nr:MAG: Crp/Fnr family transcriptional regulator [Clostridiales bacterium]